MLRSSHCKAQHLTSIINIFGTCTHPQLAHVSRSAIFPKGQATHMTVGYCCSAVRSEDSFGAQWATVASGSIYATITSGRISAKRGIGVNNTLQCQYTPKSIFFHSSQSRFSQITFDRKGNCERLEGLRFNTCFSCVPRLCIATG